MRLVSAHAHGVVRVSRAFALGGDALRASYAAYDQIDLDPSCACVAGYEGAVASDAIAEVRAIVREDADGWFAVEPVEGLELGGMRCPWCWWLLERSWAYCPACGRRLDWEGRKGRAGACQTCANGLVLGCDPDCGEPAGCGARDGA